MQKIRQIFISSLSHWREILGIYLVQLLMGLIVGLSFCNVMSSSLDQSMVLDQLAKGFDRTVIMDVVNSNDDIFGGVTSLAMILLGIYLLLSVYLQGGWLANIKTNTYSLRSMLKKGVKLIFPFMGIAIISILLIAIFAGVVGTAFTKIVGDPLVTFSSEKPYVIWILVLCAVFVLWLILVWSWSVSSRLQYIGGNTFLTSLNLGFKTLKRKWFKFLGIGVLLVGIHVVLMFLYYWIMGDRGAPSWLVVLFGIFVQQAFAIIRIVLRGFGYALIEDLNS